MALIDRGERGVDGAVVHGAHDRRSGLVAVGRHQREEGAQRPGVERAIDPVPVLCALRPREDAGLVVVPDRLCGQAVLR